LRLCVPDFSPIVAKENFNRKWRKKGQRFHEQTTHFRTMLIISRTRFEQIVVGIGPRLRRFGGGKLKYAAVYAFIEHVPLRR
jgi:hypothetical protein